MKLNTSKRRENPKQFIVVDDVKKRNVFKHLLPLFIFILIILLIVSFFVWYKYKPRAIGVLYTESYTIASKRSAFVKKLDVKLGDRVKLNQTLVNLDTNTLLSKKSFLNNSLIIAKENIASKTAELGLKQEELNLKLDDNLIFRAIEIQSARSALNEDMARLHSSKAQAKGVAKELTRNKKLVAKNAVAQSVVDKIDANYNSLLKVIEHYIKVVNADEERYKTAISRYENYKEKNYNVPVTEILRPLKEKVKQAESALMISEADIANSILESPTDGYVTSINKRNGSGVRAGETILTVNNYSKKIVEAYVRECWVKYFNQGDIVNLYPKSSIFSSVKGKIIKISQDIVFIPTEYLYKYDDQKEKGIRILIQLEKTWDSYYGTTFDIER